MSLSATRLTASAAAKAQIPTAVAAKAQIPTAVAAPLTTAATTATTAATTAATARTTRVEVTATTHLNGTVKCAERLPHSAGATQGEEAGQVNDGPRSGREQVSHEGN